MPFTTGIVTNTRDFGTASSNVVVNTRNLNLVSSAIITVQIFGTADSTSFIPLHQSLYSVPPNSTDIRTFSVVGNIAYEVQLKVDAESNPGVIMSTFGLDRFGNLVPEQGILQSELSFINALTPIS
ncbi:hypothetical protein [Priestia megaterium]